MGSHGDRYPTSYEACWFEQKLWFQFESLRLGYVVEAHVIELSKRMELMVTTAPRCDLCTP